MSENTIKSSETAPAPEVSLTAKQWAQLIGEAIAEKAPGLFVRADVCDEKHASIEDRLKLLTQLSFGIFIGVACLVIGLAAKWVAGP